MGNDAAEQKRVAFENESALEGSLQESEERFRVMAESIPQLAWLARPAGYIYWYNRRWYRYTGTTPEQMEGWGWQRVHDPDALPAVLERWKESIATGKAFDMVFPLRGADGNFRQFLTRVEPVKDAYGNVVQWCGTNTDITERKLMEDDLARLAAIVESSEDAIIGKNLDGEITFWNRAAEGMYGYSAGEVIGKPISILAPPDVHNEYPSILKRIRNAEVVQNFETRRRRKNGDLIEVSLSVSPIKDASGRIIGASTIARDITERKKMVEELRRSGLQFKLLSETAGNLLASPEPQKIVNELCTNVMLHLDCHCFFNFLADETVGKLHLNACAGIPQEEVEKIEWLDYGVAVCGCVASGRERIIAEDIFSTPDIRTELVKSYGIQAYACHPLMVQGKLIGTLSFGTKTRPHFSSDDLLVMKTVTDQVAIAMERIRLIEGLGKSRDELELRVEQRTAALKALMTRLKQSNQALQDFASMASHDLQEPLRKVISFGGMLRKNYGDSLGQTGSDYLDRMLGATERMQSLLKGLLEYSRVTTQGKPFAKVDLGEIVSEVLSDLELRIQSTGAEVQVAELPIVEGDPTQMRQVFQNLIGNALKFRNEGQHPVVEVRSQPADGTLQISVKDNGIGFDEQYVDKIFAPFQRLHGRSSQYEGTGMGLAICKKIVERHNGRLTAKSRPGEGAQFIIDIPIKQILQ
ncbi:MAG: PAS domain S-box protein [Syntrophobacteraceae bacterium]